RHHLRADKAECVVELVRITYPGKGHHPLPDKICAIDRVNRRREDRPPGSGSPPDDVVCALSLAHRDNAIETADLLEKRRPQRSGRYNMAISQASFRIHNDESEIHVQMSALKSVIHDDQVTALCDQAPGAAGAVCRNNCRRMPSQEQRLAAYH